MASATKEIFLKIKIHIIPLMVGNFVLGIKTYKYQITHREEYEDVSFHLKVLKTLNFL